MATEPQIELDLAAAALLDRLADSDLERHRRAAAVLESLCQPRTLDALDHGAGTTRA